MLAARSSTDGGQVLGDLLRAAYFGDNAEEAVVVAEVGSGGGTNNLTRLVSVGARRYVARVYGGHTSKEVMLFEHEVLGLLQRAVATSPRHEDDDGDTSGSSGSACKEQQRRQLSFRVPCLVPTRGGSDVGCTHIDVDVLRAGGCGGSRVPRYAALFEFIEGAHPSFADLLQMRDVGRSIGELVTLLQDLRPQRPPIFPRYDDLYHCHLSLQGDREKVVRFIRQLPQREEAAQVMTLLEHLEADLPAYAALPQQLVHGDITLGNVLCVGSKVTAILDFEFVTRDARMIDMAVMLARLIAEEDDQHWERIEAFVGGYGSVAHLTPEEIALLPLCLRLRRMITFLHRMAQHWDGQASLDDVCGRMRLCLDMERWIVHHAHRLSHLCAQHLRQPKK